MITLDANLAAAQALQNRRPLCRIVSAENVDPIPFVGELLSTATPNEQYPAVRAHSTGRLFVAFAVDAGGTDVLRYGYTDADRTFFTYVDFTLSASRTCGEVAVCEMADTYVGLVWEENYGGTRTIKYRKITVTGVDPSPAVTGTILTNNTADFFTGPAVAILSDDTYMLVYGAMDGTDCNLYYRTSADFVTWAAAGTVDLSALTDAQRKANPALLAIGADLYLFFDYVESIGPNGEELTNVYYVKTDDKFATNSTAAALTTYTEYGERAEHPAAAVNAAGQIYLAFDRVLSALQMDKDSTGWCGAYSHISNMHIDIANQKLYAVASWMQGGYKTLACVVQIDLSTWEIDNCWSTSSVPAFPAYFGNTGNVWWDSYHGDGAYVAVGHSGGVVSLLDADADTITNYVFYDRSAYGLAQNVTWTPPYSMGLTTEMTLAKTWLDVENDRLYVLLVRPKYVHQSVMLLGYIDITQAGPNYTFTTVLTSTGSGYEEEWFLMGLAMLGNGWMEINPAADLVILGATGTTGSLVLEGKLRVYTLSTGGLWKDYNTTSNPTFPKLGLRRGVYNDGVIAGVFDYESLYGQADYRGLCLIDLATDVVTYRRPSWESVDDYGLHDIALTDTGEYIIQANGYGVTLFNGTEWTLFSNATLPGMTPDGADDFFGPILYNPTTRMIIAGHHDVGSWSGLVMFSRDGYIRQSNYIVGTADGPGWDWSTVAPLVVGYTDYAASLAFDPDDDSLYAFWTNQFGTELSIKWDKALAEIDLSSYLLRGSPVERYSTIDPHTGAWDAGLSFEVSHGHLFDASNGASLLRSYLAKGRRIEQQFGEMISGSPVWETARVFTVSDDGEMVYERGQYPTMQVECETPRRRWSQIHIVASEAFSGYPEDIITDLLEDYAGIDSADIDLGEWDGRAEIEYQFVDVMLGDAVNQIAYHFGYAIRDGADGTIQAVKITDAGTVTRAYSDNSKLLRATPRNRHSSFVNRWTVQCEERTFTELLMQETLAAELMASHRWNTGSKVYRVHYTQGEKIFRNPRLEVLASVSSLAFQLAGSCSETLLDNSHDEADQTLWDTFCEVEVDSPDLTPAFAAALAALVAAYWLPDWAPGGTGGPTYPTGKYVALAAIFIALNILGATGNFLYRIYGQPVVKVRRTVQAQADDTDAQVQMGQVIADAPFVDPLCGSPSECQTVADFLKMVGMAERKRWSAERVADLHDEEGDTISVVHPFSGQALPVFLTDLKTTFLMPEGDTGAGGITQEIEGWRV